VLALTRPPPAPANHSTPTPETGLPYASVTSTTSGCGSGWPTVAVCPSPEIRRSASGGPGATSAENTTGSSPGTAAVTVCVPAFVPSFHVARAIPSRPVRAAAGSTDPSPAVTLNVTSTPGTGLSNRSVTSTVSCSGADCPTAPAWLPPATTRVTAGATGTTLRGEDSSPHAPRTSSAIAANVHSRGRFMDPIIDLTL